MKIFIYLLNKIFLRLGIVLYFLLFLILTSYSCNKSDKSNHEKGVFNKLFDLKYSVTLKGDSLNTLFSPWRPLITDSKIFISDNLGHQILIYEKSGKLLKKFGQKGKGPEDFDMPYGVIIDHAGNILINDRGNSRIQIFDSKFNLLRTIIAPGQNEEIFVFDQGGKQKIVITGAVASKEGKGNCLLRKYDWNGEFISEFALFKKDFVKFYWTADIDKKGCIYLINSLEKDLYIYNQDGKNIKTISLTSPSIIEMNEKFNGTPTTTSELLKLAKMLNTKEHTEIEEIFIKNDILFIFMKHIKKDTLDFILDIYDLDGNLKYYGIEVPGWLHCVSDKFYFINYNSDYPYGEMEINGYQLTKNRIF